MSALTANHALLSRCGVPAPGPGLLMLAQAARLSAIERDEKERTATDLRELLPSTPQACARLLADTPAFAEHAPQPTPQYCQHVLANLLDRLGDACLGDDAALTEESYELL